METSRERVLAAARGLLPDGSTRAVAQAAGVSVATLYRYFPSRHELVRAAHAGQLAECEAALTDATADPDPARGLRTFIQHAYDVRAADPPFVAAYHRATSSPGRRERFHRDLAGLVGRARSAGVVRPDLTPADVLLVLAAGGSVNLPGRAERIAWSRRLAEITVAGLGVSVRPEPR